MTKTFEFTIEDIKAIFEAGIHRGQEEASSFDWGSAAPGGKFDECVAALHDIINAGKSWEDSTHYDEIENWFK